MDLSRYPRLKYVQTSVMSDSDDGAPQLLSHKNDHSTCTLCATQYQYNYYFYDDTKICSFEVVPFFYELKGSVQQEGNSTF